MGKLVEVLSPEGELLRYIEVDEKATQARPSKAKVKTNSKPREKLPWIQMPPKTEKDQNGKANYPKWLLDIRRKAYLKAKKEGGDYNTWDYKGRLALVKAWEKGKIECEEVENKNDSLLKSLEELEVNELMV